MCMLFFPNFTLIGVVTWLTQYRISYPSQIQVSKVSTQTTFRPNTEPNVGLCWARPKLPFLYGQAKARWDDTWPATYMTALMATTWLDLEIHQLKTWWDPGQVCLPVVSYLLIGSHPLVLMWCHVVRPLLVQASWLGLRVVSHLSPSLNLLQ